MSFYKKRLNKKMSSRETSVPGFYFEIAWEVCHKQGGIYTFIRDRSSCATQYASNYYLVGPYLPHKMDGRFCALPKPAWLKRVEAASKITTHFGYWDIPHQPRVILMDLNDLPKKRQVSDYLRGCLQIKSIASEPYVLPEMKFADVLAVWMCAVMQDKKIHVNHVMFHEWQAACALPYLQKKFPHLPSTFMTHATKLGRISFYLEKCLPAAIHKKYMPAWAHKKQWITHRLEKLAAQKALQFFVTSPCLAEEAEYFLKRKADRVTYAGLSTQPLIDIANDHKARASMRAKVFDYFTTKTKKYHEKNSMIILIAGRYEFLNKGFHIFLDACAQLKKQKLKKNIIAVMIASKYEDQIAVEKYPIAKNASLGNPPFYLSYPGYQCNNPIASFIFQHDLVNREDSPLKILFLPKFPDQMDTFFGKDYLRILAAVDMGIFPSAYEPWGYTAHESLTMGIPTVTSSESGFGQYVKKEHLDLINRVCYLLNTEKGQSRTASRRLVKIVQHISALSQKEKKDIRKKSQQAMRQLDWKNLLHEHF